MQQGSLGKLFEKYMFVRGMIRNVKFVKLLTE